jgi:hypothetical protein
VSRRAARAGPKIFSTFFEKVLDKQTILWYNIYRKRK